MKSSWGELGKPPEWVLTGPHRVVAMYKKFLEEEGRIRKLPPKQRAVKMAELRSKFRMTFPETMPEEYK